MPLDQIDVDKDELPAEYRSQLPADYEAPKQEMTFIGHLDVLRKHLFRSVIVTVLVSIVVAFTINFFFDGIIMAPSRSDFITYKYLCELSRYFNTDSLCLELQELNLHVFDVSGQFTMHLRASFTIGIIISFPFIMFQIWQFIKPGLRDKEKNATTGVVFFCSLLFFIGVAFAYYFVVPLSYQFFSNYTISKALVNTFNASSYISMFVDIILACGIMFQLPMFIYLLVKLGIIGSHFLIMYRKHSAIVILALAAILTPSDVFSMVLVALPLLLLYEISIVVAKSVESKRNKKTEEL